ncbi:hypothetical protein LL912_23300 [Niabella sp. CC-SYL272]|uniref:hypothetical protein n=1 Tax=Niabella agricola TaxID=2891571 RepID=UPI001F4598DE|nr:hypothetical protein [Niabella agricola]MCF3111734.1 hypothetical protein [Niabella agricola]
MKSCTIITALFLISFTTPAANLHPPVNEKVWKTFTLLFKTAADAQWTYSVDFCEAHFHTETARFRAMFDYNGNLIQTIRYYKNGLPATILHKIHKRYENAAIHGVTETSDANGIVYDIVLYEDIRMLRLTVAADGTVLNTRRFKRAGN